MTAPRTQLSGPSPASALPPLQPSAPPTSPHSGSCSLPRGVPPTQSLAQTEVGGLTALEGGGAELSPQVCWAPQPLPSQQPYRPSSRRSWGKGHPNIRRIAWWGAPRSRSGCGAPERGTLEGLRESREGVRWVGVGRGRGWGGGTCTLGGAGEGPSPGTLTPDIQVVVLLRAARLAQRLTGVETCIPRLCSAHLTGRKTTC